MNNTIIGILTSYVENDMPVRPASSSVGKFYPSSVGKCSRAIVMGMNGIEKPRINFKLNSIFSNGNSYHERIEKLFKDAGILIISEMPLKDEELHISGRLDIITYNIKKDREKSTPIELKDAEGNIVFSGFTEELLVVEMKSISEKGFEKLSRPKPEHYDQLMLYLHLTKIQDGILLYESKNTQDMLEFYVEYSEEEANRIIGKIKECVKHYTEKTLPVRPYDKHSYECQYCDYRNKCWESKVDEKIKDLEKLLYG
jgi:CRISPR/Cas system-associated exonuclease Cas4 (RecB family)